MNLFTVSSYTTALHSFQSSICTAFFLFTATCFFVCVHGMYDTINSYLTKILMCATVNVQKNVARFFCLHVSNYQLSSSPSVYKFCSCFYALVYTRSVSSYNTLLPIFCHATKAKIVRAYRFVYIFN